MQMASRERVLLNERERGCMRRAGQFNSQLMDYVRTQVRAGITTNDIDRLVHEYTLDHGHIPACLGYRGFPIRHRPPVPPKSGCLRESGAR